MKDFLVRNIEDHHYIQIQSLAREKNISMNELIKIILTRALVEGEIDSLKRQMINHMNEQNTTTNQLIDVIAKLVENVDSLNKVIKHYTR